MFPKLFEIGSFPIHTYGLMLALAFLSATALLARLAEKDGIPRSRAWDLGFIVIISALAGAKILMLLTNLNYYLSQPSRLLSLEFWQAGGAFYGGLIGATLATYVFIRRDKSLAFWKVADATAPAIALGQAIGRLGCFAAGCDYGTSSSLPWAVTYTSQYAHDQVGVPLNIAVHPVQLYESLLTAVLFVVLLFLLSRRTFPGQIICCYFIGYGLIRFFVEFFRGDAGRGFVMDNLLSVPQAMSLLALAAGLVVYFSIRSRGLDKGRV